MKTDLIWPTAFVGRAGGLMSVLMASLLAGCSHLGPTATDPSADDPAPKLTHLYDYQLIDSQRQTPLTLPGLVEQLAHADVIFVGEYHGNHASHLLQAQLQAALYAQHPHQVLSLEQFERDDQNTLERYLEGQIGEKTLIKATDAWPNYAGSYRPMVHFAKRHLLPVIAANAPGAIVRCVGRHGPDYLKRLPDTQTAWVAQTPFYNPKAYQAKFAQLMQRGSHKAASASASETAPDLNARQRRSYQAQLLRDNTMAESILKAKRQYPKAQVLHLNGAFHSDQKLGTVAALAHRAPELTLAVISPVRIDPERAPQWLAQAQTTTLAQGDFLYLIQPQPTEYVQAKKRRAALRQQFEQADQKTCLPPQRSD